MMSLPSQTETHWMIMLQIGQESLSLAFTFHTPPSQPHPLAPQPSIPAASLLSPLFSSASSFPSFPHPTKHPSSLSSLLHTFIFPPPDFLRTPPIWSSGNTVRDYGQIWWCSLPTVAFNQSKSYFGDEQRGSCFFHELLYNRITQPEGQVPHHRGLHRLRWSSCLKMSFEYCVAQLAGCAVL